MFALTEEECQQIHKHSLEILDSVGVRVDDQEVFDRLCDAGGRGDRTKGTVTIPADLVANSLSRCPKVVRLSDLQGQITELKASGPTVFWTGNALHYVRGRKKEEMTSRHFQKLARVVNELPNVHALVGTSLCDHLPQTRDFVGFRIMAENTSKHLRPVIFTAMGAKAIIQMAEVLLDGRAFTDYPIFSLGYSVVTPLHWSATALQLFRFTSGRRIPIMINSEPLAGGTAPVTLAGCLVLGNAEVLSGIVIAQVLEPGRPCIFNLGFAHTLDMRTAVATTGGPEDALLAAAGADLARFHNLPCASWMSTESLVTDSQAAFEKTLTGLIHALARVNIIWGIGQLEAQLSLSAEQAVIDDKIAGAIRRAQQGIQVTEETLASDLIKQMGHEANWLDKPHTLAHYKEELTFPTLINRMRRQLWEQAGGLALEQKAKEKVTEILHKERKPHLSRAQVRELHRIEQAWRNQIG